LRDRHRLTGTPLSPFRRGGAGGAGGPRLWPHRRTDSTTVTSMSYRTIATSVEAEIEIKKSRFLARLSPAADEAEAREVIADCRAEHPKARHRCSASVPAPHSRSQRYRVDREPAATAGAPSLDDATAHDLTNVVADVTRYYGGTQLRAGALVRAYGQAT